MWTGTIGAPVLLHFDGVSGHLAMDKYRHRSKNAWHDHFAGWHAVPVWVIVMMVLAHRHIVVWAVHGKCRQAMNLAAEILAFDRFYPV